MAGRAGDGSALATRCYTAGGALMVGRRHMASAGARAYNGGLGSKPQLSSRGRAPRRGSVGIAPNVCNIPYPKDIF